MKYPRSLLSLERPCSGASGWFITAPDPNGDGDVRMVIGCGQTPEVAWASAEPWIEGDTLWGAA